MWIKWLNLTLCSKMEKDLKCISFSRCITLCGKIINPLLWLYGLINLPKVQLHIPFLAVFSTNSAFTPFTSLYWNLCCILKVTGHVFVASSVFTCAVMATVAVTLCKWPRCSVRSTGIFHHSFNASLTTILRSHPCNFHSWIICDTCLLQHYNWSVSTASQASNDQKYTIKTSALLYQPCNT